jgi:hypothetical protein
MGWASPSDQKNVISGVVASQNLRSDCSGCVEHRPRSEKNW